MLLSLLKNFHDFLLMNLHLYMRVIGSRLLRHQECGKIDDFVIKMMNLVSFINNDGFCIKNDEFHQAKAEGPRGCVIRLDAFYFPEEMLAVHGGGAGWPFISAVPPTEPCVLPEHVRGGQACTNNTGGTLPEGKIHAVFIMLHAVFVLTMSSFRRQEM